MLLSAICYGPRPEGRPSTETELLLANTARHASTELLLVSITQPSKSTDHFVRQNSQCPKVDGLVACRATADICDMDMDMERERVRSFVSRHHGHTRATNVYTRETTYAFVAAAANNLGRDIVGCAADSEGALAGRQDFRQAWRQGFKLILIYETSTIFCSVQMKACY